MHRHVPLLIVSGVAMALAACSSDGGTSDPHPNGPVPPSSGQSTAPSTGPSSSGGSAAGAATGLAVVPGCEGSGFNNHVADFSWRPAVPPGDAQRLVLSYVPGGLDTDAFVSTGPLPADLAGYHWVQMNPGTGPRTWRVLTRRGDTWVQSETATFNGVDCPNG